MGRLIDEDFVKRRMHETMDYQDLYLPVHFEMCMRDAPTVEPASPWHRVEDGLPGDGEWAIFTNGKVVTVERFKLDAYNHFFPASKWFDFEDAIAWMPLPEPPKEEE